MRICRVLLHGPLQFPLAAGRVAAGRELLGMIPSNNIYFDPPKLRQRLDQEGYLYFRNIIPKERVDVAVDELAAQMVDCKWTLPEDRETALAKNGFSLGVPFPSTGVLPPPSMSLTEAIKDVISGASLMSVARHVLGGATQCLPYHTLDFAAPRENFGFRTSSVYMNRGTKLVLIAWVPMHDIPLSAGGLCVVRGSNSSESYKRIRETYGQHEVESGNIHGDGCFSMDPQELLPLGKHMGIGPNGERALLDHNPLLTTTFQRGDLVLMTVYTMYSYLTNITSNWRISAESRWLIEGDDVGPDPRYAGSNPEGLAKWMQERDNHKRYPRSMVQAKKDWGLVSSIEDMMKK